MTVYFKTETDKRIKRGELIEQQGEHAVIRGCRQAGNFTRPLLTVHVSQIIPNHVSAGRKTRKLQHGQGAGMCILPSESIRRKEHLERLGLSEADILMCKAMVELRRRTLRSLAVTNGIEPVTSDFDFEELHSEYLVATLGALRSATSRAAVEDIAEFQDHITGRRDQSRIMLTIYRTGKTAAIRYLQRRQQYHLHHVPLPDDKGRFAGDERYTA